MLVIVSSTWTENAEKVCLFVSKTTGLLSHSVSRNQKARFGFGIQHSDSNSVLNRKMKESPGIIVTFISICRILSWSTLKTQAKDQCLHQNCTHQTYTSFPSACKTVSTQLTPKGRDEPPKKKKPRNKKNNENLFSNLHWNAFQFFRMLNMMQSLQVIVVRKKRTTPLCLNLLESLASTQRHTTRRCAAFHTQILATTVFLHTDQGEENTVVWKRDAECRKSLCECSWPWRDEKRSDPPQCS
jgi:hypothetical protein